MMQRGVFKNIFLVSVCFLASIFLVSSVLAADVAYIYGRESKQDNKIVGIFEDMGLSVDLINEDNLPNNFNSYQLIFVGDEKFRNTENIPVSDYPSVIMNYYHGDDFGLTDSDGISQLGSTTPLTVMDAHNHSIQVYKQAFSKGRIAIPYYFLDKQNIADSLDQIAATKKTSSGVRFGDVVSYIEPGVVLENGMKTQEEVCFFGIVESEFWTAEAENMFRECVNFVMSDCQTDSDCPAPFFSTDDFCLGDDIFRTETSYTCEMTGAQGVCVAHEVDTLQDMCEFACVAGGCAVCNENSDCNDGNSGTEDICRNAGEEDAFCENLDITCFTNSDCGADGFIDEQYCSDDLTVSQEYETYTCNNAGTGASSCSVVVEERDLEECSDICVSGACEFFECESNAECDDNNTQTEDFCRDPSTLVSFCENLQIECFTNADCGTDGFVGNMFCSNNLTVGQVFQTFTCGNAGTSASSCSASNVTQTVEACEDLCSEGVCVPVECFSASECDDGNVSTMDSCVNPGTEQSQCTNDLIECFTEIDCGVDGFVGENLCSAENDVTKDFLDYTCNNAGTPQSSCSSEITSQLIEDCSFGCFAGVCLSEPACSNDGDCDDGNSSTSDSCMNPGTQQSECAHEQIIMNVTCSTNSDCGVDGFVGELACSLENDVVQDFVSYTCLNPGSEDSSCTSSTELQVIQSCEFGCSEGQCMNENTGETPNIVINEFVTDPQFDWGDSNGTISGSDEWFELYNKEGMDVNLSGWTLELIDSQTSVENLEGIIPANGFFTVLNPVGDLTNDGQIKLIDNTGFLVDIVAFGNSDDGNILDNAPNGNAHNASDECISRIPNGIDTGVDFMDFSKTTCTYNALNS